MADDEVRCSTSILNIGSEHCPGDHSGIQVSTGNYFTNITRITVILARINTDSLSILAAILPDRDGGEVDPPIVRNREDQIGVSTDILYIRVGGGLRLT